MIALLTVALASTASFVDVDGAASLVHRGAVVLDARSASAFRSGHLPGAVHIDWEDFRDGWGRTGRLDDDDRALARKLAALGVDDGRAVLVYGAAREGWGEEGRIDWMLEYLGDSNVEILDGGFAAWRASGREVETGSARPQRAGHLTVRRNPALRAELVDVERDVREGKTMVLDVRTPAEWRGATPYLEARGGHIPGARSLEWKDLMTPEGRLRSSDDIRKLLPGVTLDAHIVVYCTGGVRSAFAWAALRAAGYRNVQNFDGSFWLWAKHDELPVETAK